MTKYKITGMSTANKCGRPRKPVTYVVNRKGCHVCTSHARIGEGYPVVTRNGKFMRLVRFLYEEKNGCSLPSSVVIRHTCDNPPCINLKHVVLGSIQDNIKDRDERGRTAKGERHGHAKLTAKQARRVKYGSDHYTVLTVLFGISRKTVASIRAGRTWSHI